MADDMKAGAMEPLSPDSLVKGGRRMRMRRVSAKTIRRTLRKLRMKPKGRVVLKGGESMPPAGNSGTPSSTLQSAPVGGGEMSYGGRRRRGTRKTRRGRRHSRKIFGMRY